MVLQLFVHSATKADRCEFHTLFVSLFCQSTKLQRSSSRTSGPTSHVSGLMLVAAWQQPCQHLQATASRDDRVVRSVQTPYRLNPPVSKYNKKNKNTLSSHKYTAKLNDCNYIKVLCLVHFFLWAASISCGVPPGSTFGTILFAVSVVSQLYFPKHKVSSHFNRRDRHTPNNMHSKQ